MVEYISQKTGQQWKGFFAVDVVLLEVDYFELSLQKYQLILPYTFFYYVLLFALKKKLSCCDESHMKFIK